MTPWAYAYIHLCTHTHLSLPLLTGHVTSISEHALKFVWK
jgi:hypothetical protein